LRIIEALLISIVLILFMYSATTLTIRTPMSGHEITAERALAWLLLRSDSIAYDESRLVLVIANMTPVGYVKVDDNVHHIEASTYTYPIRLIWLGFNGTLAPRRVEVGVKP